MSQRRRPCESRDPYAVPSRSAEEYGSRLCGGFAALAGTTLLICTAPSPARADALDGAALGWPWALPFIGLILTIAIAPRLAPRLWHRHYGKLAFVWGTLAVVPLATTYDIATARAAFLHALFADYLSFIVLLFALYVVAGGILITGNLRGTPLVNTAILALGTLIASLVGTTGAAMILVRPLLRANAARLNNAHVIVFFTFLAANIGGALTPLGNPPLFVGFLNGIDFFWTAQHLLAPTALAAGLVLATFIAVDIWFYREDRRITTVGEVLPPMRLGLRGSVNLLLIAGILAAILASAVWRPGVVITVSGTALELQNLLRNAVLLLFAVLSVVLTPNEHREANGFTWEPIIEVAILFGAIFACLIPVLAMLKAGPAGAFAWLLAATSPEGSPNETAYFWLSGGLSAFLDNAPTYLVFFTLAGGDPAELMTRLAPTLAAISMGATYMGALTYVGNAPNLMIRAIATERGIKMPGFLGYMAWAAAVLIPVFVLVTLVFVARGLF
jgi:Na+/H+ antiporter NhaD/arsenite permease-like protein